MKRYMLCSLVFTACGAEAPLSSETMGEEGALAPEQTPEFATVEEELRLKDAICAAITPPYPDPTPATFVETYEGVANHPEMHSAQDTRINRVNLALLEHPAPDIPGIFRSPHAPSVYGKSDFVSIGNWTATQSLPESDIPAGNPAGLSGAYQWYAEPVPPDYAPDLDNRSCDFLLLAEALPPITSAVTKSCDSSDPDCKLTAFGRTLQAAYPNEHNHGGGIDDPMWHMVGAHHGFTLDSPDVPSVLAPGSLKYDTVVKLDHPYPADLLGAGSPAGNVRHVLHFITRFPADMEVTYNMVKGHRTGDPAAPQYEYEWDVGNPEEIGTGGCITMVWGYGDTPGHFDDESRACVPREEPRMCRWEFCNWDNLGATPFVPHVTRDVIDIDAMNLDLSNVMVDGIQPTALDLQQL